MATKTSPTQLSLKHFRALGYKCQVVEHWNQWAKIRQDLFGIIDIVAIGNGEVVGIQTTSAKNHAARRTKLTSAENALDWLKAGAKLCVQSWKKPAARWEARTEWLKPEDCCDSTKMGAVVGGETTREDL